MSQRKSVIVALALLAHGGLIWSLVNFTTPPRLSIEPTETQVVLEQPTPTPTPVLPQAQQKVVSASVIHPTQQLKTNENAVVKQAVKPAQQVHTPVVVESPVVTSAAEPTASPALTGKCSKAVPLRVTSALVERNMTVRLVVRRNANNITSADLQGSTGSSSLDALIEQRARRVQLLNRGSECDGLSFTITVDLTE